MRSIRWAATGGVVLILLTACTSGHGRPGSTEAPADGWCTWWAPISLPVSAAAADATGRVPARLGLRPDDPPFPPGLAPGTEVQVFGVSGRWVLARMELASLTGAAGFVPLYLPRDAITAPLPCRSPSAHGTLPSGDTGGAWCEWDVPQRMTVSAVDRTGYVPAYLGVSHGAVAFPPGAPPGSAVDVWGFNRRFALVWSPDIGAQYLPRQALPIHSDCLGRDAGSSADGGDWCTWWEPIHYDLPGYPPAYLAPDDGAPWYPSGLPQPGDGGVGIFGFNDRFIAIWTALGAMYLSRSGPLADLPLPQRCSGITTPAPAIRPARAVSGGLVPPPTH